MSETTTEQTILSAQDILSVDDARRETVPVPEWGGAVIVRSLSGAERDKFESSLIEGRGKDRKVNTDNTRARFAAMVMIDQNGNKLFKPGDVAALGNKSAAALERVYEAGLRLSGMTADEAEELEGNSESEV